MNRKEKLSVIVPCWNCSKVICELLESVIIQTYRDWVLFCVDDKSTDDTALIISEYCKKDERIKLVERNREPKGAQTCRNIGFNLSANSEYVIWLDSDDVVAPYCFEQRVAYMDNHPGLDFGVFKAKSFYSDIRETTNVSYFGFRFPLCTDLQRFLNRNLPFVVWNNIYRRSSLIETNMFWDEKLLSLQDSDFNIQSIIKGLKYDYAVNSKIDYFWRKDVNSSSITKNINSASHQRSHIYFYNKLYESLSKEQRIKYLFALDSYLFFFIDKFHKDNNFMNQILECERFSYRPFFKFRLLLYRLLDKKTKYVLFPFISLYTRVNKKRNSKFLLKIATYEMMTFTNSNFE